MATYELGFKPPSASGGTSGALSSTIALHKSDYSENGSSIPAVHLIQPGQFISLASMLCRAATNGVPGTSRMGLYETDETGLTQGALIVKDLMINTSSSTVAWCTGGAIKVDLSSHTGKWVKVAKSQDDLVRVGFVAGVSGDVVTNNNSFPNPFGAAGNATGIPGMFVTIEDGPAVTGVNGGNPLQPGVAANWTVAGFDPAPSAAKLDGVDCSSVSNTGFTPPALVDGQVTARPGSRTLTATNGAQSDSETVNVSPPPGFNYVQLIAQSTDPARATPAEAVAGDHFMYENKNGTVITSAGLPSSNHEGEILAWLVKDDTKIAGQYAIIFGEGGQYIETRSLAVAGLGAKGLAASGLAVVGL